MPPELGMGAKCERCGAAVKPTGQTRTVMHKYITFGPPQPQREAVFECTGCGRSEWLPIGDKD